MTTQNSVEIVKTFWREVWQSPQNPDAIDALVAEEFVITTGGVDVVGREAFKDWVRGFQSKINAAEFDILDIFQTQDGSRVTTRWRFRGRNNGMMGTPPDQQAIEFTGISIIRVAPNGRLLHNCVERSAWETFTRINSKKLDS